MEAKNVIRKMTEWRSAEEMHEETVYWMSTLKFVRDEQFFLNELVRSHTLQFLDEAQFQDNKKLIAALTKVEKEVVGLMKRIQGHENLLEIMVNDIDERAKEKAYLTTHGRLIQEFRRYMDQYTLLKSRLFGVITALMKKDKQKQLRN